MSRGDIGTFYTRCGEGFYCLPGELPTPGTFESVDALRREHTGHYFDRDTLRFFGERGTGSLRKGFARIALQRNAPESVGPYAVTYWHRSSYGTNGAVTCRHETVAAARACVDRVARAGFVECLCGAGTATAPADHAESCAVRRELAGGAS